MQPQLRRFAIGREMSFRGSIIRDAASAERQDRKRTQPCAMVKGFGVIEAIQVFEDAAQVVEALGDVFLRHADGLLTDGQRVLINRQRSR